MIIRFPLLWGCIFFLTGLVIGAEYHSSLYLYITFATLALLTLLSLTKGKGRIIDVVTAAFWILLGCSRMSVGQCYDTELQTTAGASIRESAKEIAKDGVERLQEHGLEGRSLSITSALLLGQKEQLDRETRKLFSRIGAGHLLALSGLHLGIIFSVFYLLGIKQMLYSRWGWYWLPPLLCILWGFAFIAGLPVSLVRATLMMSLFLIGILSGSHSPSIHHLAISALIILIISPNSLFDIGFQFSFLTVMFILMMYPICLSFCPKGNSIKKYIWEIMAVSAIAQIGTLPLGIYYFHCFSPLGILLNIVLIPLVTLILYLALFTLLFPFPITIYLLDHSINAMYRFIEIWNTIPGCAIENLSIERWQTGIIYLILLLSIIRTRAYMEHFSFPDIHQSSEKSAST